MKGRVLAGKYRLVAELGRGGMGSVWRADHIELRSPVAVKLIDPTLAETREGQSRFLREARAAGSLRSTHVVSVFDYGVDEGTPFLVMELLEGESLASRLEKRGRMSLGEVSAIMKQVVRGLAKAHAAGIVHRDLKPENIFITTEGDTEVVKVLDFGIAKVEANIAVSVQTQTGMVLGTPYYMSPEQAEGRRELDARSDIWSLGVIVYECLLGTRPFDGDNLAQIILAICADPLPVPSRVADVPSGFDGWFARAVARRLEERFQSVQEFADELGALGAVAPIASATTEPAPPSPKPREPEPLARSDVFKNSSLEWSKDPAPRVGHDSGAYPSGSVRAVSTSARVAVGTAMVAAVGILGLGAWLWSNGGSSEEDAVAAQSTSTQVNATEAPVMAPTAVQAVTSHVPVAPAPPLDATREAGKPPNVTSADAPRVAASSSATIPSTSATGATRTPAAASGSSARPATVVAVSSKNGAPLKNAGEGGALYCSHNALSGRLVRSSPGKPGSFPCYVHSLSGELRKKD